MPKYALLHVVLITSMFIQGMEQKRGFGLTIDVRKNGDFISKVPPAPHQPDSMHSWPAHSWQKRVSPTQLQPNCSKKMCFESNQQQRLYYKSQLDYLVYVYNECVKQLAR